jgi:multidrug resistance efflux pump
MEEVPDEIQRTNNSATSPQVDGAQLASVGSQAPDITGTPGAPASTRRGLPGRIILPFLAIVLTVGGYFGYYYWQDQMLYVSTENALVSGTMVQVGSLNAGRIGSVSVDVGDRVTRDQTIASVTLPSAQSVTSGGTPKMVFRGTDDQSAPVQAPMDGIVVARSANPGDTVPVGQPIVTLVDPSRLWIQAQIEENKVGRVRVGQAVEVTFDALGQTMPGRVIAVDRVTSATFSLLPQGNSSGNFTKVTQLVPVKIAVDYGDAPLVLGSSVEVKIRVQD